MAQRYNLRSHRDNPRTDEAEEFNSADESQSDSDEFNTAKKSQHESGRKQQASKPQRLYPTLPPSDSSPLSRRRTNEKSPIPRVSKVVSRDQPQEGTSSSVKPRTERKVFGLITYVVIFLLLLLAIVRIAIYSMQDGKNGLSTLTSKKFSVFCEKIDSMAPNFSVQAQLWKVVKASVKHVLESEQPTYPGILLLATDNKNAVLAVNIAETIAVNFEAAAVSEQPQKCSFDLSEISGLEAAEQKYKLDVWLQEQLNVGVRAVVIDHLEVLAPEAALLLHGYCDSDNAPFKSALLIFVLSLDEISASPRSVENSFHKLLVTKLPEDRARALLSRVANNIGVVLVQ